MKTLKFWVIFTMILSILLAAATIVCVYQPEPVATFIINTYEDLTSNFGLTPTEMYKNLSLGITISFGIIFILNQVLHFIYSGKCKAAGEEENIIAEEKSKEEAKKAEKEARKAKKEARKAKIKELKEKLKNIKKEEINEKIDETISKVNVIANETTKIGKQVSTTNEKLANIFSQFK